MLSMLTGSSATAANATSTAQRFVPDVVAQFAALALRPDGLAFDPGTSPDPSLCEHYQGVARTNGPDGTDRSHAPRRRRACTGPGSRFANVAPRIQSAALADSLGNRVGTGAAPVLVGLPLTLEVTFTDPGLADTQTAMVAWVTARRTRRSTPTPMRGQERSDG